MRWSFLTLNNMAQKNLGQILGLRDNAAIAQSVQIFNSSDIIEMWGFIPSETLTLQKARWFISAVQGSPVASSFEVELREASGVGAEDGTGTLLSTVTASASPSANNWIETNSFNVSVTRNQQYIFLIRNKHGTPDSNNFTTRRVRNSTDLIGGGLTTGSGWFRRHSTNGGSTWGGNATAIGGMRLEFSGSIYDGLPFQEAGVTPIDVRVQGSRKLGVRFVTPASTKLRVAGMATRINISGSPDAFPTFELFKGTTFIKSTGATNKKASANYTYLYFDEPVVLDPESVYRAVFAPSVDTDSGTAGFNLYRYVVDDNAESKALLPFNSWQQTFFDGSTWTDDDTQAPVFWLIVDSQEPFEPEVSDEEIAEAVWEYPDRTLTS
jgi:hypothetical protein